MSLESVAKGILGVVAPTLGTALLGPAGGIAAKFLTDKLNIKTEELPKFLGNMSPEQLANMKTLDTEFSLKMRKMGIDIFALEVEDRKDARDMAKKNMYPQIILSSLFIIGYFLVLGLLMGQVIVIPEGFKEGTMILLGILTREVPTIMQFWFGSSHGSKDKDSPYKPK